MFRCVASGQSFRVRRTAAGVMNFEEKLKAFMRDGNKLCGRKNTQKEKRNSHRLRSKIKLAAVYIKKAGVLRQCGHGFSAANGLGIKI